MEAMKNKKETDVSAIGQFGVGFYSSYMVADNVEVISKGAEAEDSYLWKSNGKENYSIEKMIIKAWDNNQTTNKKRCG